MKLILNEVGIRPKRSYSKLPLDGVLVWPLVSIWPKLSRGIYRLVSNMKVSTDGVVGCFFYFFYEELEPVLVLRNKIRMISVPVRRIKWNWGIQFRVQFFKIINCLILVLNSETSSKKIRPSSESIKTRALRPELELCWFQTSKPGNCPTMISTYQLSYQY